MKPILLDVDTTSMLHVHEENNTNTVSVMKNLDKDKSWLLCPFPSSQFSSSLPYLLPIHSQQTLCSLCFNDLCGPVYQCGNGLHFYCGTCVAQCPVQTPMKRARVSRLSNPPTLNAVTIASLEGDDPEDGDDEQSLDLGTTMHEPTHPNSVPNTSSSSSSSFPSTLYGRRSNSPEFQSFVDSLNTTSGLFSVPSVIPVIQSRKRNRQQVSAIETCFFFCHLCRSNTVYTRAKWLEQAFEPFVQACSHKCCPEKVFTFEHSTHMSMCTFRPFSCPFPHCTVAVPSFDPLDIIQHFLMTHNMTQLKSGSRLLDLQSLIKEGDQAFFYNPFTSLRTQTDQQLFLFLRLQCIDSTGKRFIEATAWNLSGRLSQDARTAVDFEILLRADNIIPKSVTEFVQVNIDAPIITPANTIHSSSAEEENAAIVAIPSRQNQQYRIKYQRYSDDPCVEPLTFCLCLFPQSKLTIDTSK
ncbi:MAG: hypothetical protein Sylvanvirus4_23 [Sylvanvirus sp.]|uniref:RING-type E3 ubiquitin transferase n=1 Tax=Sylvanvirus sp. TaxID=2487774 RepID=A0A3G5AKY1_9VIRU|nr:MAG: hypothetical protein Sylvanvirus4_23 [Sylvanvirus sp.]